MRLVFADNGNSNSDPSYAYFPNVGGNYNDSGNAGIFNCNVNNNSTNSNANNGARNASTLKFQPHLEGISEIKSPRPWHLPKHEDSNTLIPALVLPYWAKEEAVKAMQG